MIQSYIDEDWKNFAQKYAYADFCLYFIFVSMIMIQFWQLSHDEAMMSGQYEIILILAPILSITFLFFNVIKEIVQIRTEGRDYIRDFENVGDFIACILVSVCQFYYFFTGKRVNGYFIPENDSNFEVFLLPMILVLHLNLIL